MTFGDALDRLKAGLMMARRGWNGKGMWLRLIEPTQCSCTVAFCGGISMSPWIGMKTADDRFVPWLASQTDMLAEDWEVVS